jgi:hypothetical protein
MIVGTIELRSMNMKKKNSSDKVPCSIVFGLHEMKAVAQRVKPFRGLRRKPQLQIRKLLIDRSMSTNTGERLLFADILRSIGVDDVDGEQRK